MIQTLCCVSCNREVQGAIFDGDFASTLASVLCAFAILAVVVIAIGILYARQHKKSRQLESQTPVPMLLASLMLGIGLGGFIDGIVFHQILQWHQMLSNQLPATTLTAKSVNMFWDGLFHAFTLIVVMTGIIMLWNVMRTKTADTSGRLLAGGWLIGWGLFNIVEGVLDHHILKLHNVREITANPHNWNVGFSY